MRMSRLASKERLRELVDEVLDEIAEDSLITEEEETTLITDTIWEYLTEEDSGDFTEGVEPSDEAEE